MQQENINPENIALLLVQHGYKCNFNFLGEYIYCFQTDNFTPLCDISVTSMFYLPQNDTLQIANTIYAIEIIKTGIAGVLKLEGVENTLRFIDLLNKSRQRAISTKNPPIATLTHIP